MIQHYRVVVGGKRFTATEPSLPHSRLERVLVAARVAPLILDFDNVTGNVLGVPLE
jgi:hypothetical protein